MKLTLAILLSISILTGFHISDGAKLIHNTNDMVELNELANINQINITDWSVFDRSQIDIVNNLEEMETTVQTFMNEKEEYEWKLVVEEKNHHYVWNGTKINEDYGFREIIKLKSYYNAGNYHVNMTYEVKGSSLLPDQLNWIEDKFKDKKNVFYSFTGKMASKNHALQTLAEKMISDVNGAIVEQSKETSFIAVSAYANLFNSELKTKDNEVLNLQIGLRVDNSEIDVTIGTPIITTEY